MKRLKGYLVAACDLLAILLFLSLPVLRLINIDMTQGRFMLTFWFIPVAFFGYIALRIR